MMDAMACGRYRNRSNLGDALEKFCFYVGLEIWANEGMSRIGAYAWQ